MKTLSARAKHLGLNGDYLDLKEFYRKKTVFVTGHTGFKGTWMCKILRVMGAEVNGYSLDPPTQPNLYTISDLSNDINSTIADIRDFTKLKKTISDCQPDIVIHMAAQPLVSIGYSDPIETYSTNVMGTVNILESIRNCDSVKSFLNITTDKVYHNNEWAWGYREDDILNGYDPYSNSKSCSELVTSCYYKSFLNNKIGVSTARAGNVIGGGDFTNPRIIPDCIRAAINGNTMILRNPDSTRPYQHVLEPLFAYLLIAAKQYDNINYSGSYNIGPNEKDCVDNKTLVNIFNKYWGEDFSFEIQHNPNEPHEANFLKLDCSKIKSTLGWNSKYDINEAVKMTIEWTKAYLTGNPNDCMEAQINNYMK